MTPRERSLLAAALTEATGQPWRVSGRSWIGGPPDLSEDGATRDTVPAVTVLRAGHSYLLTPDPRGWPYCRRIDIGEHVGRGWLPRLVEAATRAVREYDAHGPPRSPTARDRRRAEVYRRILRPDSGACAGERAMAERLLNRDPRG